MLTPGEAEALIAKDARNREVLFPYLNGEDLNSRWDQSPSRWVINFRDWPLDRESAPAGYRGPVAAEFPDCMRIVDERVRPERQRRKPDGSFALRRPLPERWWQYGEKRPALYTAIAGMKYVLVTTRHQEIWTVSLLDNDRVFSDALAVIATEERGVFALMQSDVHEAWARTQASSLETRLRYTPSDCFETFPFPSSCEPLASVGAHCAAHRRSIMATSHQGLTATYNRFHSPDERSPDIATLRELHAEMDRAVAAAYAWTDLDLGHGFHATKQGTRFTVSHAARREILARLLKLNHEHHAHEAAAGLLGKPKKSRQAASKRAAKPAAGAPSLFG